MSKSATSQIAQTAPPALTPAPSGILQRKCACGNHTVAGGECAECNKEKNLLQRKAVDQSGISRPPIQPKLTVGASNDPLEQEADSIADQVTSSPSHSSVSGTPPKIQRLSGHSTADGIPAPASVDRVLASPGRPLEPALRNDMEQRFGHDFSSVRLHTGPEAAGSALDVNALAYTIGHNIVFGTGSFVPGTSQGRRLLAHELTHVVQQTGMDGSAAYKNNESQVLPLSRQRVPETIQRQPVMEPERPRQKVRKIVLDKQQNAEIYELENRFESLSVMDHCDPQPGNYTARVANDPAKPGKRKWITNENIGCKKNLGYIVKTVEASKLGTLEGVEQIDFEVRDSERSADAAAIQKFFRSDKGERASEEDLQKIAEAEFILEKAGVTADELLLLEQRQAEAQQGGQTFAEAGDPAMWAAQFVQQRQQAGEKALTNREYLISARINLDSWSQDEKNGIKNVRDQNNYASDKLLQELLHKHNLLYGELMKAFEFELRSITETFLSQAQIALYRIERSYLAGRNVGLEKDALRQALDKVRPAVAERDLAESKRDERKNKLTLYGLLPVPISPDDPELAKAEAELKLKNEQLQKQSATAGVPVVGWKNFDYDALQSDDIEASRGALRQFVGHAHSQIREAQKKIEKVTTLYKADRMVDLTKATLGITKGSVFDDIISYRSKVDLSEDSIWGTLWNIVSIALIFVPGNIGLVLRVAAGAIDATKAMNEYAELAGLNKQDLSNAAPSKLGVFLAVGGTLIDIPQMAKGFVKVLDTEAALAGKAGSKAGAREVAGEAGETTVKAGDDVAKGAVRTGDDAAATAARAGDEAALTGAGISRIKTADGAGYAAGGHEFIVVGNRVKRCSNGCSLDVIEKLVKEHEAVITANPHLEARLSAIQDALAKGETDKAARLSAQFEIDAQRLAGKGAPGSVIDEADLLQQTGVSNLQKPGGPRQQVSTEAGNLVHNRRNAEAFRQQLGNPSIPSQFNADVAAGDIIPLSQLPDNLLAEVPLGVTSRVDRITPFEDTAARVIYDLKPNTVNAINGGLEQMMRYVTLANSQRRGGGANWRGVIVVYDAAGARAFIPPK